jgi:hypothetical protein
MRVGYPASVLAFTFPSWTRSFRFHMPEIIHASYGFNSQSLSSRIPRNSPRQAHVLSGIVDKDVLSASGVVKKKSLPCRASPPTYQSPLSWSPDVSCLLLRPFYNYFREELKLFRFQNSFTFVLCITFPPVNIIHIILCVGHSSRKNKDNHHSLYLPIIPGSKMNNSNG